LFRFARDPISAVEPIAAAVIDPVAPPEIGIAFVDGVLGLARMIPHRPIGAEDTLGLGGRAHPNDLGHPGLVLGRHHARRGGQNPQRHLPRSRIGHQRGQRLDSLGNAHEPLGVAKRELRPHRNPMRVRPVSPTLPTLRLIELTQHSCDSAERGS
jgi:hypothetical protein